MAAIRADRSGLGIGAAVFLAGAVLLGVELAASRVLAPFFGNSIFVWGALIGVVLAGLSVGYWTGGALADRIPAPQLLLFVLALGAGATMLVPVIDDAVLEAIVRWDPGPRLNPLLAAILLFGVPGVVLATATPIAVRLRARSLASVGKTAGRLFAVSTAGSIAGTFVTAFWLIPELGTNQLLGILATALFVAAAVVALGEGMLVSALAVFALFVGSVFATLALAPDTGGRLSGVAAQNWSPLYRLRGQGDVVQAPPEGFRLVYAKNTRYHGLPVVDDVAYRYFRLPHSPRLRVQAEDGRRYLARTKKKWDAIIIDAYFSDSLPFHLTTVEFLELVRSRLTPGGVVASNLIGAVAGEGSKLFRSMYRTYRAAFPTVAVHPVILPDEDGPLRNIIAVATEGAAPGKDVLAARWAETRRRVPRAVDLSRAVRDRVDSLIQTRDVPVLTDDYAPTDSLLFL